METTINVMHHKNVLFWTEKTINAPEILLYNGKEYTRYMDRLYIPEKPFQIDADTIINLSEIRSKMADHVIDKAYTQKVLNNLYLEATQSRGGLRVMDFGGGDGNILEMVLTLPIEQHPLEVIIADISRSSIIVSEKKLEDAKMGTSVLINSHEKLPFTSVYFDAMIANFVMHFDINEQQIMELYRVIKPGGYFVYNDYLFDRYPEHHQKIKDILVKIGFNIKTNYQCFTQSKLNKRQAIITCKK